MSRERAETIYDEYVALKVCTLHPRPVHYDGKECPCCQILAEYRLSWKGFEKMPEKRP